MSLVRSLDAAANSSRGKRAVAGMGAYVLMLVAIDYFNPSVVEPVTQLSVFLAMGLGAWWFGEKVHTRLWAAGFMVLGAFLLIYGR